MSGYIRWFLRHSHHGVEAPIPVPSPIRRGRVVDLEGLPRGDLKAAFLCPECGQVGLYSDADLLDKISGKEDPFSEQSLDLVSIRRECTGSNCGLPVEIHILWDVARRKLATRVPITEWKVEPDVCCEEGHPPQLPIHEEDLAIGHAQMPF